MRAHASPEEATAVPKAESQQEGSPAVGEPPERRAAASEPPASVASVGRPSVGETGAPDATGQLDLHISLRPDAGHAVVAVWGEIDLATVATLRRELLSLIDDGMAVTVDVEQLRFIDVAGVNTLVAAWERAQQRGAIFRIVHAGQSVRRLLALTGTDLILTTYSD